MLAKPDRATTLAELRSVHAIEARRARIQTCRQEVDHARACLARAEHALANAVAADHAANSLLERP